MLEELASPPTGIEASKFCDAYGLIDGHKCEAAGAEQGVVVDERVGHSPGAANDDEHHEC